MRFRALAWAVGAMLLATPFFLLAVGYEALPPSVPLLRGWGGEARLAGAKTPFTVFRVPVIGALTAVAAALMARRPPSDLRSPGAVGRFWLALFLTACVKSGCEGIELAAGVVGDGARTWAGRGTIGALVVGLTVAAAQLPAAWPDLGRRAYWRLTTTEKTTLVCIGVSYLVFALGPIALTGRGSGGSGSGDSPNQSLQQPGGT